MLLTLLLAAAADFAAGHGLLAIRLSCLLVIGVRQC